MTETDAKSEKSSIQQPTLSGYYLDIKIKPSSFLKSVRSAKIKAFQSKDIAQVQAVLAEKDPSLARTLALGLANRLPEVLERWVIEVAKSEVRSLDSTIMAEGSISGDTIFERIVLSQADALRSKNKAARIRAQNIIKLSLIWLIQARSLDPLQALYALSEVSNKNPRRESIRSQVQKILVQAKPGQWKILSAVARLSSDIVQHADRVAKDATRVQERLQKRVAELERSLELKQRDLDTSSRELHQLRAELESNTRALESEKQLRELDLTQAAGRTRNLLAGRLKMLLSDARDALDFEPPHIEAARQRLDAAQETIAKEVDSHD